MEVFVIESYNYLMQNNDDSRIKDYTSFCSPIFTLIMIGLYLLFTLEVGPVYMKYKKPYNLKSLLIGYNILQVLVNLRLFLLASERGWLAEFNWLCEPFELRTDSESMSFVDLYWYFYLARFLDFGDTLFSTLRKKEVTFAHVAYRVVTPFVYWTIGKNSVIEHYTFSAYINSFVRIFTYAYLAFAAMSPETERKLWWKKYIINLQVTQFILIALHSLNTLCADCNVPKWPSYLVILETYLYFSTFTNLYITDIFKTNPGETLGTKFNRLRENLSKYKKLMEVCIPNQAELYSDNEDDSKKR